MKVTRRRRRRKIREGLGGKLCGHRIGVKEKRVGVLKTG